MHLNEFAADAGPLDMTAFDEFASLQRSAADLGIPHPGFVRYVSRNVVVNHLRMHLLEWGDPAAPPVILLHGGNQSAHSWDLVSLHLADRYHVYALDQRGHGDTEWVRDADYSAPAMARDAVAFIEGEGLRDPIVFGHSMGGMVTLNLALSHPGVARGLVIVDMGPQVSEAGTRIIGNFVSKNREFDSIDEFVERVVKYDPFRTRAHMERTARYNLIRRIDGKYISKSDRILHDEGFRRARYEHAPRLAHGRRAGDRHAHAGRARRAIERAGGGGGGSLRRGAAGRAAGHRAGLRAQRALAEHARLPGGRAAVPDGARRRPRLAGRRRVPSCP